MDIKWNAKKYYFKSIDNHYNHMVLKQINNNLRQNIMTMMVNLNTTISYIIKCYHSIFFFLLILLVI